MDGDDDGDDDNGDEYISVGDDEENDQEAEDEEGSYESVYGVTQMPSYMAMDDDDGEPYDPCDHDHTSVADPNEPYDHFSYEPYGAEDGGDGFEGNEDDDIHDVDVDDDYCWGRYTHIHTYTITTLIEPVP